MKHLKEVFGNLAIGALGIIYALVGCAVVIGIIVAVIYIIGWLFGN